MSDTNPIADTGAQSSVERLKAALKAEREAHRATKAKLLAPVRAALGLPDDAPLDSITATVTARIADVDAQLAERTAALTAERDQARAEADKIKVEWNAHRLDTAIHAALTKSGVKPECMEDATTILRGVLEVDGTGAVRTKAAAGVLPGLSPDQFIVGQLRSMRPHYWPTSVGGGSKGGGAIPSAGVDVSAFKGGTLTDQMALIGRVGEKAVIDALRRSGIAAPAWLKGGGR
jgi:hypothetical protein